MFHARGRCGEDGLSAVSVQVICDVGETLSAHCMLSCCTHEDVVCLDKSLSDDFVYLTPKFVKVPNYVCVSV